MDVDYSEGCILEEDYILLPDLPGIGRDINEDALKEYRLHA